MSVDPIPSLDGGLSKVEARWQGQGNAHRSGLGAMAAVQKRRQPYPTGRGDSGD